MNLACFLLFGLYLSLDKGKPLTELLGKALSFERVLQRLAPSQMQTGVRPEICHPVGQFPSRRQTRGHTRDVASPTRNLFMKL